MQYSTRVSNQRALCVLYCYCTVRKAGRIRAKNGVTGRIKQGDGAVTLGHAVFMPRRADEAQRQYPELVRSQLVMSSVLSSKLPGAPYSLVQLPIHCFARQHAQPRGNSPARAEPASQPASQGDGVKRGGK
jgi:hypothetical protein